MVTRPNGERAQLLLIGAIAISLVILGTVVLLNGMKFTETVGTEGNEEAFTDAERTADMIESDLVRLSSRVRNETSLTEFEDALESNVTSYSHAYANMSVNRGTVYVDVSLNTSCTSCRYRLLENTSEASFTGGKSNTTVGSEIDRIPEFNMTITNDGYPSHPSSPVDASFWIVVRNESGATWKVRINETGTSTPTRYITIYDETGEIASFNSDDETWFDTGTDTELRVTDGCVDANESGDFNCPPGLEFAQGVSEPYTISFTNSFNNPDGSDPSPPGKDAEGTFRLVANGEGPADDRIGLDTPVFDIVYQRPEVQYRKTFTLNRTEP